LLEDSSGLYWLNRFRSGLLQPVLREPLGCLSMVILNDYSSVVPTLPWKKDEQYEG